MVEITHYFDKIAMKMTKNGQGCVSSVLKMRGHGRVSLRTGKKGERTYAWHIKLANTHFDLSRGLFRPKIELFRPVRLNEMSFLHAVFCKRFAQYFTPIKKCPLTSLTFDDIRVKMMKNGQRWASDGPKTWEEFNRD